MRLQDKVLAGATLSVLLAAVSAYPVAAEAIREVPVFTQEQLRDPNRMVGTVKSIIGDVVTLELTDGRTREIGLNRMERGALGLRPGMRIVITDEGGTRVVRLAPSVDPMIATVPTTRVERPTPVMTERVERRIERTTVETAPVQRMPQPVVEQDFPQRTVVEETFPQPRQTRPVRALW